MKKKYKQIIQWTKNQIKAITPGKNAVKGASLGLLTVTAILWLIYSIRIYTKLNDPWVLLLSLLFFLAVVLFAFVIRWVLKLINKVSAFYKLALFITLPLLILMSSKSIIPAIIIILASLCGAVILVLKRTKFQNLTKSKKLIAAFGTIIGFGGFIAIGVLYHQDGFNVAPITNAALASNSNVEQIKAVSPSQKGPYTVKTLTYGSGKDLHRPEYGAEVDIETDSVNGLAFIDDWKGIGGWYNKKYFGFDSQSLPLNARVWYPEGEGLFPLVLIVHGATDMQVYSDTGYEYLGELLASKGMILASVDENFLNSTYLGGLPKKENDARGLLLLEHLRIWHEWNEKEDNPFYRKIDTSNLALIGHSRGGEAVAHAAMFNKLPFYPDDATLRFEYNYNIKSIVAIAPVDGQYEPGESRTKIEDVDYFVIHGSQDADVSSFMGSQQYERITFKDSLYHFKSGLYVYGANHGQFNTSWGDNDTTNPFLGLLNLKQLISAENQMTIAKVYISSFLDITLRNKKEYLPLFVDARTGKDWLPETIYLNQFEDSNLKTVANFDEDFDVSTLTSMGGKVKTKNLSVWREQEIKLKWEKKGSRALIAGWYYDLENKNKSIESVPDSLIASYTMSLSSTAIDSSSVLVFSMAESKESANPKAKKKKVKNNSNKKNEDIEKKDDENKVNKVDNGVAEKPIDFTIKIRDSSGQEVSFPLSKFSPLQREIEVVILKQEFIKNKKQSEMVFQTFYFPAKDFQKINPNFNLSNTVNIKFIFDKNESGVVVIDNVGFMKIF